MRSVVDLLLGAAITAAGAAEASAAILPPQPYTGDTPAVLGNASIRAVGMGGMGGAIFWAGDECAWANPAQLGYATGAGYRWSELPLRSDVPSEAQLRSSRWAAGFGGFGVAFTGRPLGVLGRSRIQGRHLFGYDTTGQFLGVFSYAESVDVFSVGVNLLEAAETAGRITKLYRAGKMSRFADLSLGWTVKRFSAGTLPRHTTVQDRGALARVTPYDSERPGIRWPWLDRKVSVRVDAAIGVSKQNHGDESAFSWDLPGVARIPERSVRSWAGRLVITAPAATREALERGSLGWIWEFMSPTVEWGISRDRVQPWVRDPATGDRLARPIARGSGWELDLGGVVALRRGHVEEPDEGIEGTTTGWSLGLAMKRLGGFRFDQARVPRDAGSRRVKVNGVVIFVDPLGAWGRLR